MNALDSNNRTPLHDCARNGHPAIAKLLLKHDSSVVNALDSYNRTPLHDAARYGQIEVAKTLLKYGASRDIKNNYGRTPLENCPSNIKREMIDLFKKNFKSI